MKKMVLIDIIDILTEIRKASNSDEINTYILKTLSGDILNKKVETLL